MTIRSRTWFIILLVTSTALDAQGLIPSSYRLERESQEDAALLSAGSDLFVGYYLTSFEGPAKLFGDGVRMRWLDQFENQKRFAVRGAISFVSLRERNARIATMGNDEHPVYQNSLLQGSHGMPVDFGEGTYGTVEALERWSDWAYARGVIHGGWEPGNSRSWFHLEALYSEFRLNSFVLSVGRKPIYWGQSKIGPLLFSANAKNLDVVQISTLPFSWPFIFKYLGQLKAEIFVARMNSDRTPPNEYLSGWRIGMRPSSWFEANIGMTYQLLGEGMPVGSFSDYFIEWLGSRKSYSNDPNDSSNFTNRAFAGDIRVHLRDLSWPTSLYTEQHLEDCCGKFSALITDTLSYTFGVVTRTSKEFDAHRFRIEYSKTGNGLYFHQDWSASTSNSGRIAGNPLGRDAQGVYLDWARDLRNWEPQFGFFWEQRDRKGVVQKFDNGTVISITNFRPNFKHSEKRWGSNLSAKVELPYAFIFDGAVEIVRVTGFENSNRNTMEWGTFLRFSRAW